MSSSDNKIQFPVAARIPMLRCRQTEGAELIHTIEQAAYSSLRRLMVSLQSLESTTIISSGGRFCASNEFRTFRTLDGRLRVGITALILMSDNISKGTYFLGNSSIFQRPS